MPNFVNKVDYAVDALSSQPPKEVDENEFIDASSRVYDGVREIRRAVLLNRVKTCLFYQNQNGPCNKYKLFLRFRMLTNWIQMTLLLTSELKLEAKVCVLYGLKTV